MNITTRHIHVNPFQIVSTTIPWTGEWFKVSGHTSAHTGGGGGGGGGGAEDTALIFLFF